MAVAKAQTDEDEANPQATEDEQRQVDVGPQEVDLEIPY